MLVNFAQFRTWLLLIATQIVSTPAISLSFGSSDSITISGRSVYLNPKKGNQKLDEWITTLWSVEARDVELNSRLPRVEAGREKDMTGTSSSPVSIAVDEDGIYGRINTNELRLRQNKLVTVVSKFLYSDPESFWSDSSKGFRFSVPLSLEDYDSRGSAVGYISGSFIIKNKVTNSAFWVEVSLFDPRVDSANQFGGGRIHNGDRLFCSPSRGTRLPIVGASLSDEGRYVSRIGNSSRLQTKPFRQIEFKFALDKDNLSRIIDSLGASDDWCEKESRPFTSRLEDYVLEQASVMVEAHVGNRSSAQPNKEQYVNFHFSVGVPSIFQVK